MAGRRCDVTDVRELIRRLRLGEPARRIAHDLRVSRNTVARYRVAAAHHGWLEGPLPDPATLAAQLQPAETARPPHEQSLVEPFRDLVLRWRDQGVEGQHAFEFFRGVPRRVVLDNLKAAIVHAALHDPEVQRAYREFAAHDGFLISPCRPHAPEHKGKVEQGGVHDVKRNALAGRAFRDLPDGNRHLWRWCVETAGRRPAGGGHRMADRGAVGLTPSPPAPLPDRVPRAPAFPH